MIGISGMTFSFYSVFSEWVREVPNHVTARRHLLLSVEYAQWTQRWASTFANRSSCGTVTIFNGSVSGSNFEKLGFRFLIMKNGSGSGSSFISRLLKANLKKKCWRKFCLFT